jgi:hypothetical protein
MAARGAPGNRWEENSFPLLAQLVASRIVWIFSLLALIQRAGINTGLALPGAGGNREGGFWSRPLLLRHGTLIALICSIWAPIQLAGTWRGVVKSVH